MGLSAVSDWAAWREGDKASGLLLEKMLRPLVVDDFSNQLAGDLAPLDVQEWRQCTDAREFYYPQAHKVYQPSLLGINRQHVGLTVVSGRRMLEGAPLACCTSASAERPVAAKQGRHCCL